MVGLPNHAKRSGKVRRTGRHDIHTLRGRNGVDFLECFRVFDEDGQQDLAIRLVNVFADWDFPVARCTTRR